MNLLGKLSWNSVPFEQPIIMGATGFMALLVGAVLLWVTLKGAWPYLWREWLTSVDHKRIGVMYLVLALLMLVRGFTDAIMMRAQQAVAAGDAQGYLPPEHFDQIFSAHGTIMIFFVAMPFVIGLMNFAVPLQLGIRDVAFPTLNSVSLWLTATGILLTNMSLAIGEFAKTGWVAYPPLSELQFSPGVGVDYYLWALQISGIGTLLTGVNFVTTILKMRAPGMGYMRMPVFCWTALASNLLIVAAFPVLTALFAMLLLDRYLGFHFFSVDAGGNAMMYVNLFWVWGHPEVYILILPAFGVFSEVSATLMTRRMQHYDVLSWQPWLLVAALGTVVILAGIVSQIVQLAVSIREREQLRVSADPWNGRTLEWSTASPPPAWNYAVLPHVTDIDAFWVRKQRLHARQEQPAQSRDYEPIEMPKNSPTGFITAFFAVVTGFALIWHIWWMAALGVFGAFVTLVVFAFRDEDEVEIPAEQIERFDRAHPVEVAV